MPHTWEEALKEYRYCVNLCKFADAQRFPGRFKLQMGTGGLQETSDFEDYFRSRAREDIEVWFEVVFWKMFSQRGRSHHQTRMFIEKVHAKSISAESLWEACYQYRKSPSREGFNHLREKSFGFSKTGGLATVATFLAFLFPEEYPMVDTRIAKWVGDSYAKHNDADPKGPQLVPPDNKKTALAMADFEFVESWYQWCKHTARKLRVCERTQREWRARDVEIAVFSASGYDKGNELNPLVAGSS